MFLTMKEVASELKISLSMAYALVARGELACYEIGTCKRVDEKDLRTFLETKRRDPDKLPKSSGRHF